MISDAVVGLAGNSTVRSYYTDRDELRRLIDEYLADGTKRQAMAERGRRAVLAHHTFAHRVDRMLEVVAEVEPLRPHNIERWRESDAWLGRFARPRPERVRAG